MAVITNDKFPAAPLGWQVTFLLREMDGPDLPRAELPYCPEQPMRTPTVLWGVLTE